jgi:hypothetical protein
MGALLPWACATNRTILASAVSLPILLASNFNAPSLFTVAPMTVSNGTSTSLGVRWAHRDDRNRSRSASRSASGLAVASAAPGNSSMSSSLVAPNQRSTQAWKAVPRRAVGFGGNGVGRRSRWAKVCSSVSSSTS